MNAADVVKQLEGRGLKRSEASIKYLAHKFDLYLPKDVRCRPGLDPKKIRDLVDVLCSPLRVAEIARQASVSYSMVNYYIMKHKVPVVKRYGATLLKNKKDLNYVKSFL